MRLERQELWTPDATTSGASPPRYSYRPKPNKYATATDACMSITEDSVTVNLASIVENHVGEEEDKEDDEGVEDERDIWEVALVTEEDFESTDSEAQDWYDDVT